MRAPRPSKFRLMVAVILAAAGLAFPLNFSPAQADSGHLSTTEREVIVAYARANWDPDELSYRFTNDCTYFVSSALWMVMSQTPQWTSSSSDPSALASSHINPGPTKAAAAADLFTRYMVQSSAATVTPIIWSDNTAAGAALGDVIAYDWDGPANGTMDHLAMVTGFTGDGYPLVTQHSPSRLDRGWSWDPAAGNWIEFTHKASRAYLIHLR